MFAAAEGVTTGEEVGADGGRFATGDAEGEVVVGPETLLGEEEVGEGDKVGAAEGEPLGVALVGTGDEDIGADGDVTGAGEAGKACGAEGEEDTGAGAGTEVGAEVGTVISCGGSMLKSSGLIKPAVAAQIESS